MNNENNLVTIIIPSADPRFLPRMVPDLLAKAAGPVQVIVSLDGIAFDMPEYPNVIILRNPRLGMRGVLNAARPHVRGGWVMKTDEHCLFAEGFDEILKQDCWPDSLLIPRRYSLDAENWAIEENRKGPRDYHYLSCPVWSLREKDDYSMQGMEWPERTRERLENTTLDVDNTMSWQGSCYFMSRAHYDWLGSLSEAGYGAFAQEPQEIGLKTQLANGQIRVTKRTWYAHLHKGKKYGRGYRPNKAEIAAGHEYSAWYWMTDQWGGRLINIRRLVEMWWPVPTWPRDALESWGRYFPPGATLAELKAAALAGNVEYV